jgi:hypothetical protein
VTLTKQQQLDLLGQFALVVLELALDFLALLRTGIIFAAAAETHDVVRRNGPFNLEEITGDEVVIIEASRRRGVAALALGSVVM